MSGRRLRTIAALACAACCAAIVPASAVAADAATAATTYTMPANTPAYVRKAVEDSSRPAAQRARDINRKPAQLLTLSGVKPGDKVVEFASFGQYFTVFLSDIVGPRGTVYMYDLPYIAARTGAASRAFVAAHPNSHYEVVDYNKLVLPQNVDVVFIVLYYHDLFINHIDTASLDARIFEALKPGGVFFIVDHNAVPGSGTRDTAKLHRIDPAVIRKEVTAAGFRLVTESKLLAHPADDHTRIVFTAALRGLTDQTVFKFRKPRD